MRLALWQTASHGGELRETAEKGKAAGADLLLCPELWPTGYNDPERVKSGAEAADGPTARMVAEISAECGLAIAYGYAERGEAGIFNAAQVFGRDGGRLAHYRKTHLFGAMEKSLFAAGDRLEPPFTLDGRRIGLLICYDVEFPETVRALRQAGAELILAPTAVGVGGSFVADILVPARAIESQLHIAYANHCGEENGLVYCGASCLCGPEGKIAAAGSGPELLIADLDDEAVRRAEARVPYWRDRRPELY
jgi:predicted amidohydrolase